MATAAATASGTLTMKTQRQGSGPGATSTSMAPQIGPRTQPRVSTAPTRPSAAARLPAGRRSPTMAIVTGSSAPPPAPWMARPATMPGRSPANAQTIDPTRKSAERCLERERPADDVGEPADDGNGDDVGEEVAVDDPDVAIDVGGVDAKIGDHPGQDGGDDGEIEGAQQDRQQGGAEGTTVGRTQVHGRCARLDRWLDRDVFDHGEKGSASRRPGSAAPVPAAPRVARAAGRASPDRSRDRPLPVTR